MDGTRINNWQEIDAVEIVGKDGTRQWATETTASSYWGSGSCWEAHELSESFGTIRRIGVFSESDHGSPARRAVKVPAGVRPRQYFRRRTAPQAAVRFG